MKKNVLTLLVLIVTVIPSFAGDYPDTTLIKNHLITITKTHGYREHNNIALLNKIASYIYNEFEQYADTVYYQDYIANGRTYRNVIGSFGIENLKSIIVGAHYDVCGKQEGADDNASGVVGLIEISRLLKNKNLNYRIDLVAYSLEEPPYFRTEYMGSYIHAKSLIENQRNVYGMISLEMIGYFKDEKKSQSYPMHFLKLIYGNKGNYITLIKKFGAGKFTRKFSKEFNASRTIRTKKFTGPKTLPGVDWSDHLNYWKFGFSALMITDTSFYRNPNYHESTDTMETLDIKRMASVIDGVYKALINLN